MIEREVRAQVGEGDAEFKGLILLRGQLWSRLRLEAELPDPF